MSTDNLSSIILTLVTFTPLAGALLLMFFPRRDRDIRIFALVISLLTFVLSLHLPVHFPSRDRPIFSFRSTGSGFRLRISTTTWGLTESRCGWWC